MNTNNTLQHLSCAVHYRPLSLQELHGWASLLEMPDPLPCSPETVLFLERHGLYLDYQTGNLILAEDEITVAGHISDMPANTTELFYQQITPPAGGQHAS